MYYHLLAGLSKDILLDFWPQYWIISFKIDMLNWQSPHNFFHKMIRFRVKTYLDI